METINVEGIPPARLLAALYNRSFQQGMGIMHAEGRGEMKEEQAAIILANNSSSRSPYFDYLNGRVMKVEINGKTLDPWLYDRDVGAGAAAAVVAKLRK